MVRHEDGVTETKDEQKWQKNYNKTRTGHMHTCLFKKGILKYMRNLRFIIWLRGRCT
jgi:hypothetical protein